MYYKNGKIKYEGDFVNGKIEGEGKYFSENGEYYIGQWSNGRQHGKGKMYYKNGNIRYEGDFINGKIEGEGKYISENGEYYIGQWLSGIQHGKGKHRTAGSCRCTSAKDNPWGRNGQGDAHGCTRKRRTDRLPRLQSETAG